MRMPLPPNRSVAGLAHSTLLPTGSTPRENSACAAQLSLLAGLLACGLLVPRHACGQPALTIYNQNFAVVRDTVPLDLKVGENTVRFSGATAYLEPSSVVLRDPTPKPRFRVLEQNYRGDPVSQQTLLELNEGKTIRFESTQMEGGQSKRELVSGKIIRSGESSRPGQPYMGYSSSEVQPIIEVDGALRFDLPGRPLFPALGDDTILKPTLVWVIGAAAPVRCDAELSYVTGEMMWEADYNLVLPEQGNTLDLVGWVTIDNESGKSFQNARIKLMAGDVSKIQSRKRVAEYGVGGGGGNWDANKPNVTEKAFDEYHLYTLERQTTLLDREKKQVEFVHASGVVSTARYVYDGASSEPDQPWAFETIHTEPAYGTLCNRKVWTMREFTNSSANSLGIPLPKGRVRVYRRNTDGQVEFTGENLIQHTPKDEVVRLFTGNAFDIVGVRKQTSFKVRVTSPSETIDPTTGLPLKPTTEGPPFMDESFEITLRNHKAETVNVRVVEHLYRWTNWEIRDKSIPYQKVDAQTIEFPVQLKPDSEERLSYAVHYSW